MLSDFATEYSRRTDGELLHLASARHSLVPEAAAALDSELRRRNLGESDLIAHRKFVKRQERSAGRRDTKLRRRWEGLGLKAQWTWREKLGFFALMVVILVAHFTLLRRYHSNSDWQEAALIVMLTSAGLAFFVRSWRNVVFWISLGVSSFIHLIIVHAWARQNSNLNRAEEKGAAFLGLVLFLVVYGTVRLLRRAFRGGTNDRESIAGKR